MSDRKYELCKAMILRVVDFLTSQEADDPGQIAKKELHDDLIKNLFALKTRDRDPWTSTYAIASLVDEVMICYASNVNSEQYDFWTENPLEVKVFATRDRAWRFWNLAESALSRGEIDTEEIKILNLCIQLGFEGDRRGNLHGQRKVWFDRSRDIVLAEYASSSGDERLLPSPSPGIRDLGRHGETRLLRMVCIGLGVLALETIVGAIWFVLTRLAYHV